jgi:DNA/RNA endonuclease YhcR with UshA esterase domain
MMGAHLDIVLRGSRSVVPGGVTDTLGLRVFSASVGRYTVLVAPQVLGDSLEVEAGSGEFTITANDSTLQTVALKYLTYAIIDARSLPTNRRGWIRGVVMNSPGAFGDSTVHLSDDTAAIRLTSVRPNLPIIPGDSVLFLGRRSVSDGQPVFLITSTGSVVIQNSGPTPAADSVSSAVAATADGGQRDARLVKVAAAAVSDTVTVSGHKLLTVDDGSGPLTVVLSQSINFGNRNLYQPGITVDVSGLLVPDPVSPGVWLLKPRFGADIAILP